MTENPYGLVHAKSLLAPCGASEQWDIDERGVFPKPQPTPSEGQTPTLANQLAGYDLLLAWRPAEVFKDDTPAPDHIKQSRTNQDNFWQAFDRRDFTRIGGGIGESQFIDALQGVFEGAGLRKQGRVRSFDEHGPLSDVFWTNGILGRVVNFVPQGFDLGQSSKVRKAGSHRNAPSENFSSRHILSLRN